MQVSSESGWSPDPEFFAKRQYKKTEWGWFPVEDAFGGGECPGGRRLPHTMPNYMDKIVPKKESSMCFVVWLIALF